MSIKSILQTTLNDFYNSNASQCNTPDVNSQSISFRDLNFVNCLVDFTDESNSITLASTVLCLQTTPNTTSFTNSLANSLAGNQSVLNSLSNLGSNNATIATNITNQLDINGISSCIETVINDQSINISGVSVYCTPGSTVPVDFSNISNNLYGTVVMSCSNNAIDNFVNGLDQTSQAPQTPQTQQTQEPANIQTILQQTPAPSTTNVPLIIGLSIGCVSLLIIIVICITANLDTSQQKVAPSLGFSRRKRAIFN